MNIENMKNEKLNAYELLLYQKSLVGNENAMENFSVHRKTAADNISSVKVH